MAITLADGFSYQGAKPLDARLKYSSVSDMVNTPSTSLYDGCWAYVTATKKYYSFDSSNDSDPTLGKWREYQTGGGGATTLNGLTDVTITSATAGQALVYDAQNSIWVNGTVSGGSDNIVEGYYNPADGLFYREDTYTTAITGAAATQYVDLSTNRLYRYSNGAFVPEIAGVKTMQKQDFDLLPTSEKNNGQAYFIPDANIVSNITVIGNRFDKANIYTETERMIGSYLGKPLYQKTIVYTTDLARNNWTEIPHNITNLGDVVDCQLINVNSDGYYTILGGYRDNNLYHLIHVNSTSVGIYSSARAGETIPKTVITIRYTKTSDATVSIGTENDYSTDEMIIGTWIDGKPLYQKTFSGTWAIATNATQLIGTISDMGTFVNAIGTGFVTAYPNELRLTDGANGFTYANTNGNISVKSFSDITWKVVTVQYTKTTD